ncbi:MAG: pyruvate ferredoxin oxidoreductase [Candidatus Korarchaeota archaeon]|nr:pyruvate ferredoxin oxidoreductase [Candidatus Korarchaeota archaeon]NIU83461.1 pyruvate ferredoxin oxidoreductase [Candidatus Thorarchaeota archaeon]NIW13737.1 pyruvate ferredoxin oxidoreductase [Candidatus Thorarchaeota archaeon]NIW51832.1 pyruvate ferredoxin oxidoreductase [Candidatus Korarchaeota archaeon]
MLQEITWLGRGGQGGVTGTRLLASSALKEEIEAQSIVFFTAERRGSPVFAFNRVSDSKIKKHSYPSKTDVLMILDPVLLTEDQIQDHLKEGGTLIVNSENDEELRQFSNIAGKIARVDATQIAIELDLTVAGLYVTNTIMLGAFSKAMGYPKITSVETAIKERWPGKVGELNAKGARMGYEKTNIVYEENNAK